MILFLKNRLLEEDSPDLTLQLLKILVEYDNDFEIEDLADQLIKNLFDVYQLKYVEKETRKKGFELLITLSKKHQITKQKLISQITNLNFNLQS